MGLAPPQMIVINVNIKEMHFKNVNYWAHKLYKKILNTLTLLNNCISLRRHFLLGTTFAARRQHSRGCTDTEL